MKVHQNVLLEKCNYFYRIAGLLST